MPTGEELILAEISTNRRCHILTHCFRRMGFLFGWHLPFVVVALVLLLLALSTDWISNEFLFPSTEVYPSNDRHQMLNNIDSVNDMGNLHHVNDKNVGNYSDGGHWEHVYNFAPPYVYSPQVCAATYIAKNDCLKTEMNCTMGLMNWVYVVKDTQNRRNNNNISWNASSDGWMRYPKFDVDGFRTKMKNSRILFLGSSLIRQQVQALVWTLGHTDIQWEVTHPASKFQSCTTTRFCMTDHPENITICYQFMGSMSTQVYREGNYTLNHRKRKHGDSSCLLHETMIVEMIEKFDMLFVQNLAWYTDLGDVLDSPTSPSTWVSTVIPTLYYDAMEAFLANISTRIKTVLVLGQVGTDCIDKNEPEPFNVDNIPSRYGWKLTPLLWEMTFSLIRNKVNTVQIVDVRDPLMQSVHAHPFPDCLHFCLNSAAVSLYLDKYWVEVFSQYYRSVGAMGV